MEKVRKKGVESRRVGAVFPTIQFPVRLSIRFAQMTPVTSVQTVNHSDLLPLLRCIDISFGTCLPFQEPLVIWRLLRARSDGETQKRVRPPNVRTLQDLEIFQFYFRRQTSVVSFRIIKRPSVFLPIFMSEAEAGCSFV